MWWGSTRRPYFVNQLWSWHRQISVDRDISVIVFPSCLPVCSSLKDLVKKLWEKTRKGDKKNIDWWVHLTKARRKKLSPWCTSIDIESIPTFPRWADSRCLVRDPLFCIHAYSLLSKGQREQLFCQRDGTCKQRERERAKMPPRRDSKWNIVQEKSKTLQESVRRSLGIT